MPGYFELRRLRKRLSEIRGFASHALHADDDILDESKKSLLRKTLSDAEGLAQSDPEAIGKFVREADAKLASAFRQRDSWQSSLRELLDVLAVALAVAFGVRALYLQPFKIPTSSMQPTLFGIHYVDRESAPSAPNPVNYLTGSIERADVTVKEGGEFEPSSVRAFTKWLLFTETSFKIGDGRYAVPGEPKHIVKDALFTHGSGLFKAGEKFCDGWLCSGDHLFVDRVSLHFREPRRGDVVVFNTEEIERRGVSMNGYYYIKRLVGLPGDTLKIVDGVLQIKPDGAKDFKPATEFSPKFDKIYSGMGGYQGHRAEGLLSSGSEVKLPPGDYFMMGDNTSNSFDSRGWGFVPRRSLVGLARFVFWPVTRRWGLVDAQGPVERPTRLPQSMWLQ